MTCIFCGAKLDFRGSLIAYFERGESNQGFGPKGATGLITKCKEEANCRSRSSAHTSEVAAFSAMDGEFVPVYQGQPNRLQGRCFRSPITGNQYVDDGEAFVWKLLSKPEFGRLCNTTLNGDGRIGFRYRRTDARVKLLEAL